MVWSPISRLWTFEETLPWVALGCKNKVRTVGKNFTAGGGSARWCRGGARGGGGEVRLENGRGGENLPHRAALFYRVARVKRTGCRTDSGRAGQALGRSSRTFGMRIPWLQPFFSCGSSAHASPPQQAPYGWNRPRRCGANPSGLGTRGRDGQSEWEAGASRIISCREPARRRCGSCCR